MMQEILQSTIRSGPYPIVNRCELRADLVFGFHRNGLIRPKNRTTSLPRMSISF